MEAVPAPSSAMVMGESNCCRERGGVRGEDGTLGAGEVVLGEGGDLLEELGAALVVEEPRGKGFLERR